MEFKIKIDEEGFEEVEQLLKVNLEEVRVGRNQIAQELFNYWLKKKFENKVPALEESLLEIVQQLLATVKALSYCFEYQDTGKLEAGIRFLREEMEK